MSDNIWQRLAQRTPKATGLICWADVREWLDEMAAAEDAEREGHLGCDHAAGECIPDALNVGKKPAALPNLDDTYADGSPAYRPKGLPPLDPALVEECVNLYWGEGDDKQSMERVLTHYRERVEGPLREELARTNHEWAKLHDQQMDDARKWESLATKAQSDLILSERDVAHWQRKYEEMRRRVVDAEAEVEGVRAELDLEKKCRAANKHAVVLTVGGTVDGAPTNETNYLQRLRELVKTENEYLSDQLPVTQPTDEERQRLADMARYYGGQGASSLVYVRADDMRRIATLLEKPAPAPARKSIGRRWAVHNKDGTFVLSTDAPPKDLLIGDTVVLCDLVPVAEEEKP